MKKSKKLLSLLLAFVMVFGVVSSVMVASAADNKNHLKYNDTISKKNVDDLIVILDGMVQELVPTLVQIPGFTLDLKAFAKGDYYTSKNAAELTRTVYTMVGGMDVGAGISTKKKPVDVFSTALQEKYPSIKAVLAAAEAKQPGSTNSFEGWSALDFSNIDLKCTDRKSFLNVMMELLGPLAMMIYFADSALPDPILATEKGYYNKLIIPVFQTLGITNYPSAKDYTASISAAAANGQTAVAEAYLMPLLTPALDLIEGLAKAPLTTLLQRLPNIVYSFEQGRLDGIINMLTTMEGMEEITATLKELGILVDGKVNHDLVGIATAAIGKFLPGAELKIPALDIIWDDVMKKYGSVEVAAGAGQDAAQKVIKTVDSSDMFMYVFNYVADVLEDKGNQAIISKLLTDNLDASTASLINSVITLERQDLLFTVMSLLGVVEEGGNDVEDPETPDGGNNGSEIPKTGDVALSAIAMLAVAGVAGLVITKKKEN